MANHTGEDFQTHAAGSKTRKLIGLVLILVVVAVGIFKFTPAKSLFTPKDNDPRMQDSVFVYAANLAKGMRNAPLCIQMAKMMINAATPGTAPENYRAEVVDRIFNRVPESCVAPAGSEPAPAITEYLSASRPQDRADRAAQPSAQSAPQPAPVSLTVPIDPFVVNLQPEDGDYFLQVAMSLNMNDQAGTEIAKLREAEIRSRILSVISSKKPSEILTNEGKTVLAKEIVTKLNEPLSSGNAVLNVQSLFFTSFVVQK